MEDLVVRLSPEQFVVVEDSFVRPSHFGQEHRSVHAQEFVVGELLQGCAVGEQGFFRLALSLLDGTEVVHQGIAGGQVGIGFDGLTECLLGQLEVALSEGFEGAVDEPCVVCRQAILSGGGWLSEEWWQKGRKEQAKGREPKDVQESIRHNFYIFVRDRAESIPADSVSAGLPPLLTT